MSETREEVDAVKVIYAAEFCESLTARQVQSLLDTLALKAGLESDGLVVLRYEGDAVTVAGRLVTDHVWGGMERFFLVAPDA
jgi:hypothetical protein